MRVLLCDDYTLLVEALEGVLLRHGHEVVVSAHPRDALTAAPRCRPDLCVMDRSFPDGEDGIDAVAPLLASLPGLRVVLLTGLTDPEGARRAVQVGARGYLMKSASLEQLLHALEQVHGGLLVVDRSLVWAPPAAAGTNALTRLTSREREVMDHLVAGRATRDIARAMAVSYSTARSHVQSVLDKLHVHSRLAAVALAVSSARTDDRPAQVPAQARVAGSTVPLGVTTATAATAATAVPAAT